MKAAKLSLCSATLAFKSSKSISPFSKFLTTTTFSPAITAEAGLEYKITTNKWLTPKGTWINEVGIEPNIVINQSGTYYNNPIDENDNQLQKAIETLVS